MPTCLDFLTVEEFHTALWMRRNSFMRINDERESLFLLYLSNSVCEVGINGTSVTCALLG